MKAVGFARGGADEKLALIEAPVPEISSDEVLVSMKAAGVGKHDRWFLPSEPIFPFPIGIEGAGIVERVGTAVADHQVGARVMFVSSLQPKGGTWAEFAVVTAGALIPIPDGLSFVDAAALPVAGGMALEGMQALALEHGETLLIAGGSGAIGTLAIQLAVARGVRVAVTASADNHALVLSLGAERAFDYRDPEWPAQVQAWQRGGVDAALAIPFGTGSASLPVVRAGGRLVTISGDAVVSERGIAVQQAPHTADTRRKLAQLAMDAAAGRLRITVEQTYPLAAAITALEKTETGHARGKSVLTL